jgi:hypothetical protein
VGLYELSFQGAVLLGVAIYGFLGPVGLFRWYFFAQAVYTVATFGPLIYGVDLHSPLFTVLYIAVTVMMLGMGIFLTLVYALQHTTTTFLFLAGIFISIALLWVNINGQQPHSAADWIYVIEGASLMGMGLVLGITAPFLYGWEFKSTFTLAMMWIFLGVFRQEYRLHYEWKFANQYAPWFVTVACLLFVAWTIRSNPVPQALPVPWKPPSRSSGRRS